MTVERTIRVATVVDDINQAFAFVVADEAIARINALIAAKEDQ